MNVNKEFFQAIADIERELLDALAKDVSTENPMAL